jgi:hypothetical protein
MRQKMGLSLRIAALVCVLGVSAVNVFPQGEGDLTAKMRLSPTIGPGFRAFRVGADGKTYVLASPSPGLLVLDAKGKQLFAISESSTDSKVRNGAIAFGEDCDVDAEGRIYVADRGANAVEVFAPDGTMLRSMQVPAPLSVAAIGEGEVAVATLREPHLVIVFDKNGRDVREFGDPEQISEREDLNRFLNIGQLASDPQGHVYYAFNYSPEPTVRLYDRNGYGAGADIRYLALEAAPAAQAIRREIVQQEKHRKSPSFKRLLTAVGVDRTNGEVWIAVGGDNLLHFDKDGNRRASYQIYTPEGARLEANTIYVDRDHLIIGSDPLGIYQFERPDKSPHQ